MLKLLKNNLKQSWFILVLIFVLLCAQAMADLNLPDFTSRIVNIGIQQKGVVNSSPDVITNYTLDKVLLLTKEDDFILKNYQVFSKDNLSEKEYNKYLKLYPNIKNQESYVIKNVDDETREKLNLEMGKALMLVSMLENDETAEKLKEQMVTFIGSGSNQMLQENYVQNVNVAGIMEQDLFTIISSIPEEIETLTRRSKRQMRFTIKQQSIVLFFQFLDVIGQSLLRNIQLFGNSSNI